MKALFVILFLLVGLVSTETYAGNNNNDPQQQDQKKTAKPKYDFNIFKFFSVPAQQQLPDSLKSYPTSKNKSIFLTKKDFMYLSNKKNG